MNSTTFAATIPNSAQRTSCDDPSTSGCAEICIINRANAIPSSTTAISPGMPNSTASLPYGYVGVSDKADFGWTQVFEQFCNHSDPRLYCFEQ